MKLKSLALKVSASVQGLSVNRIDAVAREKRCHMIIDVLTNPMAAAFFAAYDDAPGFIRCLACEVKEGGVSNSDREMICEMIKRRAYAKNILGMHTKTPKEVPEHLGLVAEALA
ncbi:MAG: hypothetical protein V1809_02165 [Planctomycetota bacterium]